MIIIFCNGFILQIITGQLPGRSRNTNNLAHPPFTFLYAWLSAGILLAVRFTDGKAVATELAQTPGKMPAGCAD